MMLYMTFVGKKQGKVPRDKKLIRSTRILQIPRRLLVLGHFLFLPSFSIVNFPDFPSSLANSKPTVMSAVTPPAEGNGV